MKKKINKITVGRIEKIDFLDLNIDNIQAKVDTGAYSSSLHCEKIKEEVRRGKKFVSFHFFIEKNKRVVDEKFTLPVSSFKDVRSSSGETEKRFFIKCEIQLLGEIFTTEFSLTDRSSMKFPVLLGRKALAGKFLVDVSRYNIGSKIKKI